MRIRKGDSVVVISGKNKSTVSHRVLQVLEEGRFLLVEGVNRVYKHVRKGHPKSVQGGRLQLEMPIDASKVMFVCPSCQKPSRLGARYLDDGQKERFCKKCSAGVGTIGKPREKYAKKA